MLVICLAIELSVRAATGSLFIWGGNEIDDAFATDPMLGRVIVQPGRRRHATKGFTVTIGDHGTRLNGNPPPRNPRPRVLVVGDSFAFGDGVSDGDTWPAVLERRTGGPVINAGMIGFGVDQAVLRAEQLVDVYAPDTIVLGFIPHDVLRCEMSYWSGFSKPYFAPDASGLRFHPAEVPTPSLLTPVKRLLAMSLTLDRLFTTSLHWQGPRERYAHHQGREVACRLMERLAGLAGARPIRVVVVAYPQEPTSLPEDTATKDAVLACARANHLLVLDLFPAFEAGSPQDRERRFDRHFSVEGNRLVGTEVAALLAAAAATATPPPE